MPMEHQAAFDGALHRPLHLKLQWHITERCNFRCAHCYQESYDGKELAFEDLCVILEQFKQLLATWDRDTGTPRVRAHIDVTGGEPFVRSDFLDLLEVFRANRDRFSFGILTNGSFIDAAMARRLRELGPTQVQVSIEGAQPTNDRIRGPGAYDQTVSALKCMAYEGISTRISFTAQRSNFVEFLDVARLGMALRASRVWADRLIPPGNGAGSTALSLSPQETKNFFEIMYRAHNEAVRGFCRTEIFMGRALQFLVGGGTPYHCSAGDNLVTVQPNGDLYPCRRMPIRVGNLLERPLTELYCQSDLLRALRDRKHIPEGCRACRYSESCGGGLRCLSYAVNGDPFTSDPGCWRAVSDGRCESGIPACQPVETARGVA